MLRNRDHVPVLPYMMCVLRVVPTLVALLTVPVLADPLAPLPLSEVLARVREQAPHLRSAEQRQRAAQAAVQQADRLPNPSLELSGENWTIDSRGFSARDPTLDFFATLTQPIEVAGKRAARTGVASADVEMARADALQDERTLILETTRLYLLAVRSTALSTALATQRSELQILVDMMGRRVTEGYAPRADLMRFLSEVARLDLQLAQSRLDLERSTSALAGLLGDTHVLEPRRLVQPELVDLPDGESGRLVERLLDARPEMLAARARVERARQVLQLERARRFPDPALTAGYKRTASTDTAIAGVLIPLPIFDANGGNVERAAAEERAACFDLDRVRLQLHVEITSQLAAARDLSQRARRVEAQLLVPAQIVRDAARASFREGATNILQLMDAERSYVEARREALDLTLAAFAQGFEMQISDPQRGDR